MNKKIYTLLIAFISIVLYSCNDDEVIESEYNPDREFMTMFRQRSNTGLNSDQYACGVSGTNDIQLYWYGVKNCAGYRIKMKIYGTDWNNPYFILKDTIVGPEVLNLKIEDLQYKTVYSFAIQTLSEKGDAYNSRWYGLGSSAEDNERTDIETLDRYEVPEILQVENVTKTSMRVHFNLTWDEEFKDHFEQENGLFVMDQIKIEPASVNPELESKIFEITDEIREQGYIDVDGLSENALYMVNGFNNRVKRYWDRLYNTIMVRMKGDVGDPILLKHYCDPNDTISAAIPLKACRIDTVLNNYMSDNSLAEGSTFLLEGGKVYYLFNNVDMSKGFILKSNDPNNRPTVYLGIGLNQDGSDARSCNFSFGRGRANGEIGGIEVQSIIFQDINFDCEKAYNYGNRWEGKGAGTGNYFINQNSGAMPFGLESFEIRNCNFRNMIRGWIRIQGPNRKTIKRFVIDNCLFSECGYHQDNGRGYSWIAGDGRSAYTNIFEDLSITNCTFVDSPRHALLSENANLAWPSSTKWNIRVENNTFINFSTRSNGRLLFEMRYLPNNSKITCKKNLFVLVKAGDDDVRDLYQAGMDVRNFNGIIFDFADNYSTLHPDKTPHKDDEIFSTNTFSASNRGAGYNGGRQNIEGQEQTKVRIGTVGISPTDLMVDPRPLGKAYKDASNQTVNEPNMHIHNLEGLRFKNTDQVRNHEIYKLGIGDPRWR